MENDQNQIRAIKDIKEGEEITISYLGGFNILRNTFFRQNHLFLTWHFVCQCDLCKNQGNLLRGIDNCSGGTRDLDKFFIMSTEFDKNISDWSHYCTGHKNGNDFFMSLVKWPKIAVKKANFFRNFSCPIWCYTKLIKTKKLLLNWYFSTKFFFRKIRRIFDVENRLWKSDFGTFWCLFLAI